MNHPDTQTPRNPQDVVYSTEFGTSAVVFPKVLGLYVPDGSVVADLTYCRGVFWRKVDPDRYQVLPSDIFPQEPQVIQMDARRTAYRDGSLDAVVIDPPYGNASTVPRQDGIRASYRLDSCMTPDHIAQFYYDGIDEAFRILRCPGILITKSQNFVNGGRSHWMTNLIWAHAVLTGFRAEGQINMVPPGKPIMRHRDRQQHERKNHSTFWVFRKAR